MRANGKVAGWEGEPTGGEDFRLLSALYHAQGVLHLTFVVLFSYGPYRPLCPEEFLWRTKGQRVYCQLTSSNVKTHRVSTPLDCQVVGA